MHNDFKIPHTSKNKRLKFPHCYMKNERLSKTGAANVVCTNMYSLCVNIAHKITRYFLNYNQQCYTLYVTTEKRKNSA